MPHADLKQLSIRGFFHSENQYKRKRQDSLRSYGSPSGVFSLQHQQHERSTPSSPVQISESSSLVESKVLARPSTKTQVTKNRLPLRELENTNHGGTKRNVDSLDCIPRKASRTSQKNKYSTATNKSVCDSKRPFQQMYLDFGQRNFAQQILCKTCGMMFVHGVAEDAKQHALICESFVKGVPFCTTQARVVAKYQGHAIVEIRPTDTRRLRQKVFEVLEIVDHELGITSNYQPPILKQTAYLLIAGNRVVALVTAECIEKAYELQNNISSRSQKAQRAMVGINRMWVNTNFRKQGIATKLIDIARSRMVFGITVPSALLAFSSPTQGGVSFGLRYLQGNADESRTQLLVYDCGCEADH